MGVLQVLNENLASVLRPSGIGWRLTGYSVAGLVLAVLVSCAPETRVPVETKVLGFIDGSPQEIFEIRQIATEVDVVDLSPDPALETGGWKLEGDSVFKGWKSGLLAARARSGGDMVFARALDGAASEIDVVEVDVGGLRPSSSIRVFWTDQSGKYNKGRSIRLGARHGVGTTVRTFRFDVGNHPLWNRKASLIGIRAEGERSTIRLGRVVGIRLDLDTDRLLQMSDRSWVFDIGGRHRTGLLAVSGSAVERPMHVPPGAELRFGLGVPDSQPGIVRFRVTVLDGSDAAEAVPVFEHSPDDQGRGVWTDHVVDLSVFANRDVRLVLDVEGGDGLDLVRGAPVWSNPVVWAPTVEDPPPNVVLISVDTLRADHMSLHGYERPTTRGIDRWAADRGVVFTTAVAPSPWTLPSHVSMLTGLDAVNHGVNHPAPAPTTILTVAEMLRSKGYATAAVTGGSYLHPRFGLVQGFDDYRSYKGDLALELETGLEHALDWIDDHASRGPFFFFFHTYEVHDPYDPREPYFSEFAGQPFDPVFKDALTRNSAELRPDRLASVNHFVLRSAEDESLTDVGWDEVDLIADLYDSGIAYADERLTRLLDRLSQPDLRDNTMVILTSDHGEAIGEHRLAGHSSLYDHDLLVPLVVALPGGKFGGRRVEPQVRTVDIPATVLDVVGVQPPPGLDGRSLMPLINGDEDDPRPAESYAALSNHGLALRTGERDKYIFRNLPWPIPAGHEELFDLELDPAETNNLAGDLRRVEQLRRSAAQILEYRLPGLRLVMANHGAGECLIELGGRGLSLNKTTLKTTDPGGWCEPPHAGRVRCRVGPGEELTLVGERVLDQMVVIEGVVLRAEDEDPKPFELVFEVGVDHEPRSVVIEPALETVPNGGPGEGGVTLTLSWAGDPTILGIDPAESDIELRRQLEALGYIQ